MIKTFRGSLPDGGQNKIRLSTKKGKIGYKIIDFRVFPSEPGQQTVENIMAIWKVKQASVSTSAQVIDFADNNMLAVGIYHEEHGDQTGFRDDVVIFDREVFNQDIFITHTDTSGAVACNYYLELETETLTDNAAAVSTLRDIRLNPQVGA